MPNNLSKGTRALFFAMLGLIALFVIFVSLAFYTGSRAGEAEDMGVLAILEVAIIHFVIACVALFFAVVSGLFTLINYSRGST